jgi:hypothetical protein
METYRSKQDAQGTPILGSDGRYQRDALTGIFVMRKEKWFGRRYKEQQTGDWEYASYRADKTANVVGDAAAQACAACHLDAGPSRDWVYRGNLFYAGGSGAPAQVPQGQPADQPSILNYTFLPATTTVKHTLTTEDGTFSGLIPQGATIARTFSVAGTFKFFCAIHPTMRTTVVVEP